MTHPEIWPLVIEDMQSRDKFRQSKKGTTLTAMDKFGGLQNAYEEPLDLVCNPKSSLRPRPQA